ncbi:MAG TPA: tetratricopeptide repeat protein [Bryobacteraceae bacterium]
MMGVSALVFPSALAIASTLCLLARPPVVLAQMMIGCHPMEMQDQTPPEQLPAPQRMTGIGNAQMQITAAPEAQMWFNQGLNLLHDFWDYESARAFEQSIRVDPECAMCYWGLYQAESFYHSLAKDYAHEALEKALRLKARTSGRERLYLEATAAGENARKKSAPDSDRSNVQDLWRELTQKYPEDTQARIFYAANASGPEELRILESVLRDKPDDSAANHYYIHALEGSDHPERALHSAEILASLAPASGHMVHMPGHIFFRLGDYARAERAFAESTRVDEHYMKEQHVQPDNDWNYVHNLMYAVANLMEEGKLTQATALSAKLSGARGELESTLYIYSARDSVARLNARLPVALRTADWAVTLQLLGSRAPDNKRPHLEFLAQQLVRFAGGMLAVETRDLVRAQELSDKFDAELWRVSQAKNNSPQPRMKGGTRKLQVLPDALLQPELRYLSIMSLELRATLSATQGKMTEAKSLFSDAAREEKALGYHEPPNYIRPVGETAGAAMMTAGDWAQAKDAYERALLERPKSGFALYGIALCAENSGDGEAAAKEYKKFLAAWKDANPTLVQVEHARKFVTEYERRRASSPQAGSDRGR